MRAKVNIAYGHFNDKSQYGYVFRISVFVVSGDERGETNARAK